MLQFLNLLDLQQEITSYLVSLVSQIIHFLALEDPYIIGSIILLSVIASSSGGSGGSSSPGGSDGKKPGDDKKKIPVPAHYRYPSVDLRIPTPENLRTIRFIDRQIKFRSDVANFIQSQVPKK